MDTRCSIWTKSKSLSHTTCYFCSLIEITQHTTRCFSARYDYSFFNTIPAEEKEKPFKKFAVPESYKVSRQLVLNSFSNIDFKKPHSPILFIGGGKDHIFPPNLTQSIAGKYKDANSQVTVKIFEDKSHFICGELGWEKVADYILDWHENQ